MTVFLSRLGSALLACLTLAAASGACTAPRQSAIEPWTVDVALAPAPGADRKAELWLLIRNNGSVTKTICVESLGERTSQDFALFPVGPSGGCEEDDRFEAVPALSARVVRVPVPSEDWLVKDWQKHITVWFAVRSWTQDLGTWSENGRGSAEWTGTSRDARALGDRLIGR